jgi:hypothetical protein
MSDEKPPSWCKGRFAIIPLAWLKLSGREMRVAAALSSFASRSGEAFPSLAKLTDVTGIHERDLRRILSVLRDQRRIIDIESQPGRANTYLLHDPGAQYDPEVPF